MGSFSKTALKVIDGTRDHRTGEHGAIIMCKDCREYSSDNKNFLSKRDFMKKALLYGASGALLFMIEKPKLFASGLDVVKSTDEFGQNNCYKLIFNALNRSEGHFAPPDAETVSGEKFKEVYTLFKSLFSYPFNQSIIDDKFPLFVTDYKSFCKINPDIIAMVFSCLEGNESPKTSSELFTTFQSLYSDFATFTQADLESILDKFLVPFSLVKNNTKNGVSRYSSYPFLFGMGDENYAGIVAVLFGHAENNPDWAADFWKNMEAFMFSPSKASMVYQSWDPPKYRIMPAQSASSIPGTNLFKNYIAPILHNFDKLENYVKNNQFLSYATYNCGCMIENIQKDQLPKEATDVLYQYFYDVSMRQTAPEENSNFKTISDGYFDIATDAEDHNLVKQVFNFKADPDFSGQFMCNCYDQWCIQLRPRNLFWNEQVANEAPGTKISVMQRALYKVELKNIDACNGCQACHKSDSLENANYDIKNHFVCPAHAITTNKTKTGIVINHDRCLGCLLCVRNCFRVRKSNRIALSVSRKGDVNKIPNTYSELINKRKEMASKYNWTSFQYDVQYDI